MNYRHAYHAGNFADVVKHAVLCRIVTHLRLKPGAFRVIDTHAGAGVYDLAGAEAGKTGEWRDGIGRLIGANAQALPGEARALLAPYLEAVAASNPSDRLTTYPGSPALVRSMLRPQDRLIACELEPAAATALAATLRGDPRAKVLKIDGWTALSAYLPPKDPAHRPLYELLRSRRILEKIQAILSPFRLPARVLLKVEGCDGVANAYSGDGMVTVCYEYLDEIWQNVPTETTPEGVAPIDALAGPLVDVFFHEFGHVVFHLLQVPILGREEDAADQFSAYMMLNFGPDEARRLIATGAVNMAPTGLEGSRAIFTLLALPVVLAGLLGERRTLLLALGLSILAVAGITGQLLARFGPAEADPQDVGPQHGRHREGLDDRGHRVGARPGR